MKNEIWKQINNSNYYMISNFGRIKSFKRNKKDGQILKTDISNKGYFRIMIDIPEKRKRHSVHRLVALAFIDNTENKCCINHIDNNRQNNKVDNLEWCTQSENIIHAEKQGRLDDSHIKTGKATSENAIKYKIDQINKSIGNKINDLTVLSFSRIEKKKTARGNKYFINYKCICGRVEELLESNVNNNAVTSCSYCRFEKVRKNNYNTFYNEFINSRFKHYDIIDISKYNKDTKLQETLLTLNCINCNHISTKTHKDLFRKNRKTKCEYCNYFKDQDMI